MRGRGLRGLHGEGEGGGEGGGGTKKEGKGRSGSMHKQRRGVKRREQGNSSLLRGRASWVGDNQGRMPKAPLVTQPALPYPAGTGKTTVERQVGVLFESLGQPTTSAWQREATCPIRIPSPGTTHSSTPFRPLQAPARPRLRDFVHHQQSREAFPPSPLPLPQAQATQAT